MALPGDPARRQRGAVPAADRPALLRSRQGDPPRGRQLPARPEGRDLRHRRHVASDLRPARRPDQLEVRQGLPRRAHQEPEGARPHAAHRIHARGRRRGHRDGDVAGDARRARRQGEGSLPLLHRAGFEHRRRPHHPAERRGSRRRPRRKRPRRRRKPKRRQGKPHEDLRCRPGCVWPEASRRAEAHSGRGSHLAGRRQPGFDRQGRREIRHQALHRRPLAKASSAPTP